MPEPHKYVQLADTLRSEIKAGVYPPGTRLPDELRWNYRAQPQTWQRALSVLAREGMTTHRWAPNGGWFVADNPGHMVTLRITPEVAKELHECLVRLSKAEPQLWMRPLAARVKEQLRKPDRQEGE